MVPGASSLQYQLPSGALMISVVSSAASATT
jgi:hypothetical protein